MALIGNLGSVYQGIELHGVNRKSGKGNNSDVYQGLKDQGRDLGPNEADAKKAAVEYVKVITRYLKSITQSTKPMAPLSARAGAAAAKRQARVKKAQAKGAKGASMADARAYKKAGKAVMAAITARMEKNQDKNGTVTPVDPDYAKTRERKYGIPKSEVFKAQGELLANYAAGRLKLIKK